MLLLSVIIPVYNAEKYLSACIESVLNQTLEDFEIILVDDGSTDNSKVILKSYENIDKRVRIFHQQNSGPSKARNVGISYAKGNYIVFVDADDYIDRNYLKEAYNFMKKYNCDLIIGSWKAIYINAELLNGVNTGNSRILSTPDTYELISILLSDNKMCQVADLLTVSISGPIAKLYKKDLIDQYYLRFPENLRYAEDVLFNLQYLFKCSKVYIADDVWYFSNRNQGSTCFRRRNVLNEIITYKKMCDLILENQNIPYKYMNIIRDASSYRYFMWGIEYIREQMKIGNIRNKDILTKFVMNNLWFEDSAKIIQNDYISKFQIFLKKSIVEHKNNKTIFLLYILNFKRKFLDFKLKD